MKRAFFVALCTALLLVVAGCGGNETTTATTESTTTTSSTSTETTTAEQTVNVVVEGGAPKGGIVRATLHQGDRVVLVVKSDVADEIHLHGYDLSTDVAAGGTAQLAFTADIAGRFEVELESRGVLIADLTVS
jgi:hypothetical protein